MEHLRAGPLNWCSMPAALGSAKTNFLGHCRGKLLENLAFLCGMLCQQRYCVWLLANWASGQRTSWYQIGVGCWGRITSFHSPPLGNEFESVLVSQQQLHIQHWSRKNAAQHFLSVAGFKKCCFSYSSGQCLVLVRVSQIGGCFGWHSLVAFGCGPAVSSASPWDAVSLFGCWRMIGVILIIFHCTALPPALRGGGH